MELGSELWQAYASPDPVQMADLLANKKAEQAASGPPFAYEPSQRISCGCLRSGTVLALWNRLRFRPFMIEYWMGQRAAWLYRGHRRVVWRAASQGT
ncbi:hypothetical protein [Paenibacillus albidus]|uniref:hypothetical protein n=1 Tax=Paenibacillus albidus TaxID=2041023 RepID=UPI001669F332|nr:hypothetical protein [Paenibacillus albidus]